MQAHILIFSSGNSVPIAEALKQNLERNFIVDLWTEDFFNESNVPPLNTCLKKLLRFDAAIVVMGSDDVQIDNARNAVHVPRDNVIFELGASMARMGIRKVFVVVPDKPQIKLPSYFKGLEPLIYGRRENDSNLVAATGTVAKKIREQLDRLEEDIFHSDLPAVGLAYGYFANFVLPLYNALRERECIRFSDKKRVWQLNDGFCITVAMPESIIKRESVDELLLAQFQCTKGTATLNDGRDLSVYLLPSKGEHSPLEIIDVPTTLLTCSEVIERVDSFWGSGDREFKESLAKREIAAFERKLRGLISREQLRSANVRVLRVAALAL